MTPTETVKSPITITVENIGGIAETDVTFSPGVTVLEGRNATNRTSLLRAVKAALGSDDVALKGDATEGEVELSIGDQTYTRSLYRRDGSVEFDGDPYLEDSEIADLFAFLLESNVARRAVERGENLQEVVMRPVDTAEIDAEIERLQTERQELEAESEDLDRLAERLPELEQERTRLQEAIDETEAQLESRQAELDELRGEADQIERLEANFEELRETRNRLKRIRADIVDERRVLEALRADREELQHELDGLAEVDSDTIRERDEEIDRLRERSNTIDNTVSQLQSAIQFNERMLNQTHPTLESRVDNRDERPDAETVTDQLVVDNQGLVCWSCGSQVQQSAIEETLELLRGATREKIDERNAIKDEIDDLQAEKRHIQRTKERRVQLNRELEDVEAEIESRSSQIEELEHDAHELEERVAEVETAVDELESGGEERLTLYREITELGVERDRYEADLTDVEEEIEGIEDRLGERDELEARIEAIKAEITDLRSRIDRIQSDVVDEFNDHMEALLELLEFENLERIWIERVETANGNRRDDSQSFFDLHVIRTNESGSVYEDSVAHLSESEREVVGLVFALSGYLAHEVYDRVPFMLLDSLEALDSNRIAGLVDYLTDVADNLMVALLPEDAAALDDQYQRVKGI